MATAAERMTESHRHLSLAHLWATFRADRHDRTGRTFQAMDREKARHMQHDELPLRYEL